MIGAESVCRPGRFLQQLKADFLQPKTMMFQLVHLLGVLVCGSQDNSYTKTEMRLKENERPLARENWQPFDDGVKFLVTNVPSVPEVRFSLLSYPGNA
ncbi:hypothetical protein JOQ06_022149 [Pogonophryne albipinna]|uniref:Uncharacterized protein n=1 Tax=Pogonophryne albipinna TaxID=1090488 RepID=A0AAD6F6G8_9TELE|nr:hypothetical protein JOQ06_022149 [Pogonophryne albipinna]